MRILLDFDEVINQMLTHWIETLNCVYGTTVDTEDVKEWDITKAFPKLTREEIFNPLCLQTFWSGVKVEPGARDGIVRLLSSGHEVYIVTSTHPDTVKWKAEWIQREIPEISWSNVIVADNKSVVNGDVLIDDGLHNIYNVRCNKIIYDKPWNNLTKQEEKRIRAHRAHNWNEILRIIDELSEVL